MWKSQRSVFNYSGPDRWRVMWCEACPRWLTAMFACSCEDNVQSAASESTTGWTLAEPENSRKKPNNPDSLPHSLLPALAHTHTLIWSITFILMRCQRSDKGLGNAPLTCWRCSHNWLMADGILLCQNRRLSLWKLREQRANSSGIHLNILGSVQSCLCSLNQMKKQQ